MINTLPRTITIDMTPTWEGLFPIYMEAAHNGNHEARGELLRMAQLADHFRRYQKAWGGAVGLEAQAVLLATRAHNAGDPDAWAFLAAVQAFNEGK